eukprot:109979_1
MQYNPPPSLDNNNNFDQHLMQKFAALPSNMPPVLSETSETSDIRFKQDVFKALHNAKSAWLINCQSNKTLKDGYKDHVSGCIERFIKEMDTMHLINQVAVREVGGLVYYGFKMSWQWLAWYLHNELWPTKPNPFPSPFTNKSDSTTNNAPITTTNNTQHTTTNNTQHRTNNTSITT